jgi:hypothetical protein
MFIFSLDKRTDNRHFAKHIVENGIVMENVEASSSLQFSLLRFTNETFGTETETTLFVFLFILFGTETKFERKTMINPFLFILVFVYALGFDKLLVKFLCVELYDIYHTFFLLKDVLSYN